MPARPLILVGRRGYILIPPEILSVARQFLGPSQARVEAGGILLGAYRGDHLEVVDLTTPMHHDRRTPVLFDRRDRGHGRTARAAWQRSGGTVTCVGEWHTHVAGSAGPSGQDLWTWRRLLRATTGRQHVFMIVSSRDVRFVEGRGGDLTSLALADESREASRRGECPSRTTWRWYA